MIVKKYKKVYDEYSVTEFNHEDTLKYLNNILDNYDTARLVKIGSIPNPKDNGKYNDTNLFILVSRSTITGDLILTPYIDFSSKDYYQYIYSFTSSIPASKANLDVLRSIAIYSIKLQDLKDIGIPMHWVSDYERDVKFKKDSLNVLGEVWDSTAELFNNSNKFRKIALK